MRKIRTKYLKNLYLALDGECISWRKFKKEYRKSGR